MDKILHRRQSHDENLNSTKPVHAEGGSLKGGGKALRSVIPSLEQNPKPSPSRCSSPSWRSLPTSVDGKMLSRWTAQRFVQHCDDAKLGEALSAAWQDLVKRTSAAQKRERERRK